MSEFDPHAVPGEADPVPQDFPSQGQLAFKIPEDFHPVVKEEHPAERHAGMEQFPAEFKGPVVACLQQHQV